MVYPKCQIEDGDNIISQRGHVAPDSQIESLCTGSTMLILTSSDGASDEAYEQENSKFG